MTHTFTSQIAVAPPGLHLVFCENPWLEGHSPCVFPATLTLTSLPCKRSHTQKFESHDTAEVRAEEHNSSGQLRCRTAQRQAHEQCEIDAARQETYGWARSLCVLLLTAFRNDDIATGWICNQASSLTKQ